MAKFDKAGGESWESHRNHMDENNYMSKKEFGERSYRCKWATMKLRG